MNVRSYAVGIVVGASLLSPTTSLAQDWDQAMMGTVAAYKNSEGICYYAPDVAPIIDKMDDYLTALYGTEWEEGLRQLQMRITPMVNAWRLGGVPECSFYGQAVARGLQIAPIMVGLSADVEVTRLTNEGGRRLEGAPAEDVQPRQNEMAEFMEQYDANNSQGDVELSSITNAQDTYKLVATNIRRDSSFVTFTLEAKGTRIDHRDVRLDCGSGTVETFNEFDVRTSDGTVRDIRREMEEAQGAALVTFCGEQGD